MTRYLPLPLFGLLALAVFGSAPSSGLKAQQEKPDEAALKRARREVRLMDDVYKTAIVLITDTYVKTNKDYPAGRAAVKWLKAVADKGWPEVRLVDVSGEPYNPANVARDEFEKAGVKVLKAGKDYYEQIETKGSKSYLRAVTAVPVVMEKCILCHENYKLAKKGAAIGALSYTIPIE
jgi:hypothetical protein